MLLPPRPQPLSTGAQHALQILLLTECSARIWVWCAVHHICTVQYMYMQQAAQA
jgi:hypothetical protein